MWIFGPLVAPRTSAWTSTLDSASESEVTVWPSTRRTAGSDRLSPGAVATLSISMTSPTATFCCWPPLRTIAYTSDSLSSVGLHLGGVRRRVRAGGRLRLEDGHAEARQQSSLRISPSPGQNGGLWTCPSTGSRR